MKLPLFEIVLLLIFFLVCIFLAYSYQDKEYEKPIESQWTKINRQTIHPKFLRKTN